MPESQECRFELLLVKGTGGPHSTTTIETNFEKSLGAEPMSEQTPDLSEARQKVLAAIERLQHTHEMPIVIALDGKSGSGKSTLASLIAEDVHAAVIQLDDFFAANIPDAEWDSRTVEERATDCFEWQRVRSEALEPLISGRAARWYPFDFDAGLRPDGTYGMKSTYVELEPAPVILLEGNFSTGPQLVDLINVTVLVEPPDIERHARLAARDPKDWLDRWHLRWDAVEDYYFTSVRPRGSFDLVVTTMEETT